MQDELPQPFDNDDESAFETALTALNQSLHEAKTVAEQREAVKRIKAFLEHQRVKREFRYKPTLVDTRSNQETSRDDE